MTDGIARTPRRRLTKLAACWIVTAVRCFITQASCRLQQCLFTISDVKWYKLQLRGCQWRWLRNTISNILRTRYNVTFCLSQVRTVIFTELPNDGPRIARLVCVVFSLRRSPRRCSGHPSAVSPQDVGSRVVGDLLRRTADYLGHTQVSKAVIAVPAKFDARQRAATVEAFRLAGLQVGLLPGDPKRSDACNHFSMQLLSLLPLIYAWIATCRRVQARRLDPQTKRYQTTV